MDTHGQSELKLLLGFTAYAVFHVSVLYWLLEFKQMFEIINIYNDS
jgi:hypothetical protein